MNTEQMRQDKIEYFRAQAEQYNFTREYSKAMEFYIRAGILGDLESIQEACEKLRSGYGLSYNYNEIFRCMKVGAKAGIVDAMLELSICYSSGLGTEIDNEKALYWLKKGAQAGSGRAKLSLEGFVQAGQEAPKEDREEDVKIYPMDSRRNSKKNDEM